jgi:hypothetical protein
MDSTPSPHYYQCKFGRVQLLTADNYADWSTSLINFLKADRTWKIVQGIETSPPTPQNDNGETYNTQSEYEESLEVFESKAAKACSMILSSVSPSFQQFIYAMTDPMQMWTTLKSQLDSMNANAGPYILRAQFFKEKFNGTGPISAFFAKLLQYQTRLASTAYKIQDIDIISHVLSFGTLPTKFESTVEILRLQPNTEIPTLTQILVNKEIQLNTLSPLETPNTAMVALRPHKNQPKKGKRNDKRRNNRWPPQRKNNNDDSDSDSLDLRSNSAASDKSIQCYYCCKIGHRASDCRLKKRAREIQQRSKKNNSNRRTTKDYAAANIADATVLACYTSLAPAKKKDPYFSKAWHIDSGASDHICNNKNAFLKLQLLVTPIQVRIGDNSTVPAIGTGSVLLSTTRTNSNHPQQRRIQLTEVLYVPDPTFFQLASLMRKAAMFVFHAKVTQLSSTARTSG